MYETLNEQLPQAAAERLKEQEFEIYSLKEMLDRLQEGIYVTDKRGVTLYVNTALLHLSGLKEEQLIGKRVHDLRDAGILPNSCCAKVIETRSPVSTINNYYHGQKCLVSGSPIFDPDGNLIRTVAIVRDVSELDAMMERLSQNEQKADFIRHSKPDSQEPEPSASPDAADRLQSREPAMNSILAQAVQLSQIDGTVLITGETGTGKNHLAMSIHNMGAAKRGTQSVCINCGAIPEHLIESELFGYESGAFTGALPGGHKGLLESAGTGTVILDEIGDMPYLLQVKLLGALNDRQFYRIGGNRLVDFKARVIATTNADMEQLVAERKFRSDLFYRLNVFRIDIPPLRERKADILPLAEGFRKQFNTIYRREHSFDERTCRLIREYPWPGNIRELKSFVEKAAAFSGENMTFSEVSELLCCPPPENTEEPRVWESRMEGSSNLKDALRDFEKQFLTRVIHSSDKLRDAADTLGIDLSTLMRKKKRLNISLKPE